MSNPTLGMSNFRGNNNDYLLLLGANTQPAQAQQAQLWALQAPPRFGGNGSTASTIPAQPFQLQPVSVQPVSLQFDSPQFWAQQPQQQSRPLGAPAGLGSGLPPGADNANGNFMHQFMFTLYQIILDLLKFINENLGGQQQQQQPGQQQPQAPGAQNLVSAPAANRTPLQANRGGGGAVPALLFQGQVSADAPAAVSGGDVSGPVAANERARAYGDPHIEGGDGERFDFDETGIFSLLEDSNLALNAEMGPAAGEKSVITNAGLNLSGQSVQIKPTGEIIIDGRPHTLREGQSITTRDGSRIVRQGNNTRVHTAEYDMTFTQRANNQYLDVAVQTRSQGVFADGVMPGGILGETFDADHVASPNTKRHAEAYRRNNLFS